MNRRTHITHCTQEGRANDGADGLGQLFSMVYSDLEHIARGMMRHERAGHTLGTHGLVHETYAKIMATYKRTHQLDSIELVDLRSLAAVIMRRTLVDHARKRKTRLAANDAYNSCLEQSCNELTDLTLDLVALEDALIDLESIDPRKARVVELRFFGAMPMTKIAQYMEIPMRTVERDWSFSRAWLLERMKTSGASRGESS